MGPGVCVCARTCVRVRAPDSAGTAGGRGSETEEAVGLAGGSRGRGDPAGTRLSPGRGRGAWRGSRRLGGRAGSGVGSHGRGGAAPRGLRAPDQH